MSKIQNVGLDQYGAEPFEQQQFGTAGVERVKVQAYCTLLHSYCAQIATALIKLLPFSLH